MENSQLENLSAIIGALSQNPAALSMLGSIMQNINKNPPAPEQNTPDMGALFGLLGSKKEAAEGSNERHEAHGSPFGSKEDNKKRIALLNAVKPFLGDERREKLDMIIKLLRLSELGELASLLGKMN